MAAAKCKGQISFLPAGVARAVFFKPRAALAASEAAFMSHGAGVVIVVIIVNTEEDPREWQQILKSDLANCKKLGSPPAWNPL